MSETPLHTEFAAWLNAKMAKHRLNNSGLARLIWGTIKDSRGYEVSRNRDRISHYLAGTQYPHIDTVWKLGDIFSTFPDDIPGPSGPPRGPRVRAHKAIQPAPAASIHHKLDRILDLLTSKPMKESRR